MPKKNNLQDSQAKAPRRPRAAKKNPARALTNRRLHSRERERAEP
jgi:hypothetical protein